MKRRGEPCRSTIAKTFALVVGTMVAEDSFAGSPLEETVKVLRAIQSRHDVVRGVVLDGGHPLQEIQLPNCMVASNEAEWNKLWSIVQIDPGVALPSDMAAVAVVGPGFSCPTGRYPEIVEVADVSSRRLVTYLVRNTPTNLCGVNPSALVVVRFIPMARLSEAVSVDESGRKQTCGRPQS
jgi:hypothetical protein